MRPDDRAESSALLLGGPIVLALLLGLTAQGSRPLWEPDEGRNAAIAGEMLKSGDWLTPRLGSLVYLDKPPLAFWPSAGAETVLGMNELALRLPNALAYAATTAVLVWLAAAMWGRRSGAVAGLIYGLALGPFVVANILTPDTLLALWTTLTAGALWRACDSRRVGWWILAGLAAGTGLSTKGAAMLVFVGAFGLAVSIENRGLRWLAKPGPWLAFGAALAVGLPWFVWAATHLPGAADYFLSNQVVGRLVDERFDRNPQWYGPIRVYLPVLAAGMLPWTLWIPIARLRAKPSRPPGWPPDRARALLLSWIFLPLAVFAAASSRLPLYVLPLFAPLSLAAARFLDRRSEALPWLGFRRRSAAAGFVAFWILLLLSLKIFGSGYPSRRDGAAAAVFVRQQLSDGGGPVWVVDTDLHSLPFYGVAEVRRADSRAAPYPMYETLPVLRDSLAATAPEQALFITVRQHAERLVGQVEALSYRCERTGSHQRLVAVRCRSQRDPEPPR